eukprot:gene27170-biopygen17715
MLKDAEGYTVGLLEQQLQARRLK